MNQWFRDMKRLARAAGVLMPWLEGKTWIYLAEYAEYWAIRLRLKRN